MAKDLRNIPDTHISMKINYVSTKLSDILKSMGKKLSDYDLPKLSKESRSDAALMREILEEQSIVTPAEDVHAISKLNVDQKALLAQIRASNRIAIATATSGVAASISPGGRTAHSRFQIPLDGKENTICKFTKQSSTAKLLMEATIIIWDEAPMSKKYAIDTLDRSLRDIMESSLPFGGKVIVFGGDFRKVVPRATRAETIYSSLARSYLWGKMEILTLKKNMRAENDPKFSDYLLRIGNGDEESISGNLIQIPADMLIEYEDDRDNKRTLIDLIFPDLDRRVLSSDFLAERAILTTKNEFVDDLNKCIIDNCRGDGVTYYSYDSATDDTNGYYPEEFLNSLTPNGLPRTNWS
ncbi:ATP-dependent DNA helicase PIF1-like [Tasmannia lanceolata]|uniref:ATP-dependent DNA helicase PIF1-like n=1 Tax=Tasmannia lanceolata TaxID=3420 RepID=UPI004062937D